MTDGYLFTMNGWVFMYNEWVFMYNEWVFNYNEWMMYWFTMNDVFIYKEWMIYTMGDGTHIYLQTMNGIYNGRRHTYLFTKQWMVYTMGDGTHIYVQWMVYTMRGTAQHVTTGRGLHSTEPKCNQYNQFQVCIVGKTPTLLWLWTNGKL